MTPIQLLIGRRNRKLTQEQAAKLCDVSRVTYSKWERGRSPIPPHIAGKLGLKDEDAAIAAQRAMRHRVLLELGMRSLNNDQNILGPFWIEPNALLEVENH